MDCIEIDLIPVFTDIYNRAYAVRLRGGNVASCENALLALEAARVDWPVQDFTELYHEWANSTGPF